MAEDLQHLLDRIQKDGVEKAQAAAEKIVSEARGKAGEIVKAAEAQAAAASKRADEEAVLFAERGRKAVEVAARDAILSIQAALLDVLGRIVRERTEKLVSVSEMKDILLRVAEAYLQAEKNDVEIAVNPRDEAAVRQVFMAAMKDAMEHGLTVRGSNEVISGFKVTVSGSNVEHDFSGEAIAETLSRLVRPYLAEIIRSAAKQDAAGEDLPRRR